MPIPHAQGLRALWITWAEEMKDCPTLGQVQQYQTLSIPPPDNDPEAPVGQVWPMIYGTTGYPTPEGPYGGAWASSDPMKPENQTSKALLNAADLH